MFNYLKGLVKGKNKTQENLPQKNPVIIGEGAYGCVYKPALTCKNNAFGSNNPMSNKVSKLMRPAESADEMVEYNIIDRIEITGSTQSTVRYELEATTIGCKNTLNQLVSVNIAPKPMLTVNTLAPLCDFFTDITGAVNTSAGVSLRYFQDVASRHYNNTRNLIQVDSLPYTHQTSGKTSCLIQKYK
jgi:hypothetical protein